ncbi:unnamed protein product [Musa hybrid cultivar]
MDGTAKRESHLPSARTPVEGGVQDACGDACSIRLEPLCEIDPSTVPEKISVSHVLAVHRFEGSHLVHMNWELLEAVERESSIRLDRATTTTIFHHAVHGDFNLQHVGRSHDHLQYLVFSTNSIASSVGLTSSSAPKGENEIAPATVVANPSSPISNPGGDSAEVTNIMLAHASNKYSYFKSKVRLKPAGQSNLRLTKMDQNHQTSNCSQNL